MGSLPEVGSWLCQALASWLSTRLDYFASSYHPILDPRPTSWTPMSAVASSKAFDVVLMEVDHEAATQIHLDYPDERSSSGP